MTTELKIVFDKTTHTGVKLLKLTLSKDNLCFPVEDRND